MKFIGKLMLFCLALALIEKMITAMMITFGLAVIYGLFFQPAQTIRCIVVVLMLAHPGWTVALLIGTLCLTAIVDCFATERARLE